ncbi:MAG: hypothetical protein LBQ58_01045 [Synergistaceae bacterium]|nr:hypothetical protein [Synergistaceae bacterium]
MQVPRSSGQAGGRQRRSSRGTTEKVRQEDDREGQAEGRQNRRTIETRAEGGIVPEASAPLRVWAAPATLNLKSVFPLKKSISVVEYSG